MEFMTVHPSPERRRTRGRRLTDRQTAVLELVATGLENKEIAHQLGISEQAVKEHVSNLLRLLAAPNRAALGDAAATLRFAGTFDLDPTWLPFLFRKAPLRIAIFAGPDHRLVAANEEHLVTVQGRDVMGKTFGEIYPDITDGTVLLDQVYRTGERMLLHERETRYARGDGDSLVQGNVTVILQPLPADDGKVAAVAVLSIDVSESVRTRRQLQKIESERLAILDQLPSGVIVVDRDGLVVSVNEAGRRIVPFASSVPVRPRELLDLRDITTGAELVEERRPLMRALGGERAPEADYLGVVVATGDEVPLRVSAAPLFDEAGEVYGAIAVFTKVPRPRGERASDR
jgi:DNA-binding CsgD family transcriptional regulator